MSTLIMWHNRFSGNENEAVKAHIPQHRDSKTKKPRCRDYKAEKLRHRDRKTKKPRHRGILTLMPPDILECYMNGSLFFSKNTAVCYFVMLYARQFDFL